jgi:hypothetical protein
MSMQLQNLLIKPFLCLAVLLVFVASGFQGKATAQSDSVELTVGVKHIIGGKGFKTIVTRNELPLSAQNFTMITVQSSDAPFAVRETGIEEYVGRPEGYVTTGNGCSLPYGGRWYVLTILYDDNRNPLAYNESIINVPSGSEAVPTPTQPPVASQPSTSTGDNSVLGYGDEYKNMDTKIEAKFSDVLQDHWAFKSIMDMSNRKVLDGYPDGKFRPDNVVSRAEFAKIMVLAAGITPEKVTSSTFSDIKPTDWYTPFIEAAKDYLNGYTQTSGKLTYDPNAPATREDVAVALVKLKGYDKTRLADLSIIQAMFKDYDSISPFARSYIALAVENKLVSGFPDETFKAQMSVTRAQAAAMMYRAYQYGSDVKGEQSTKVEVATPTPTPFPTPTPKPTTVTGTTY